MDVKGKIEGVRQSFEESVKLRENVDVRRIAWGVVYFAAGLVLSMARVLGSGSPFGIAAVAAAGAGINGVCCLLGSVLGHIISAGLSGGVRYIAAVLIVYTAEFAFCETKIYSHPLFAPLTAAAAALVTGLLAEFSALIDGTPTAAIIAIETALAFGGCLFFREAMSDREPATESSEMRHSVSVLISIAAVLMALSGIEIIKVVSVGRFLSLMIVQTCAFRCGMMMGCTVGAAFGFSMDLAAGGVPFYTMAYALAGLTAGVFNKHGRFAFVMAFIVANAAAVVCAWSSQQHISALFEEFCASVIFMVLPSGFLCRLGALIQTNEFGSGESGLRRYVSGRVACLSEAYAGLYEIVRRNVEELHNDSDPSKVFDKAADAVCIGCRDKNRCWNSNYLDTLSAMNDAQKAIEAKGTLQLGDIPRRFAEKCRTPEAFVAAVNGELRAVNYRRQFSAALKESRDTAWGQYADMADILYCVSRELGSTNGADHLAERRLIRYLRTLDIDADTAVYRDGSGRLRAVIESGNLSPLLKKPDYLDRLSEVLGTRLCRPKIPGENAGRISLLEAEPLAVNVGIAAMKKPGEKVSGDKGTYFKTDAGVLCVILSDGMGSGGGAARESTEVIEILEKFLRAGMEPSVAMKTLNSVMLLKSGSNRGFATVDLMCVNLFTGETGFYKYGAAPSYVFSGKSMRRIKCASFAPGLSTGMAPDVVRMRLKPGCTAIIASDGVIADSNDGWLREIMDTSTDDMKLLARDTLREAEKIYGSCDDMTVLAVRVEARK